MQEPGDTALSSEYRTTVCRGHFDTVNYKIVAGGEEPAAGSVPGGEGGHPGGHADPERAPPGRGATDVDQASLPGLS